MNNGSKVNYLVKVNATNLNGRWPLPDIYFDFDTVDDAISFLQEHYLEDVFIMFNAIRDMDNRIDQGSLISTSWYDVIKYESNIFKKS